jgi:hypothetical protein
MKEHLDEFERQMEALVASGKLTRDQADSALRIQNIIPAHLRTNELPDEAVTEASAPQAKKFTVPTPKKSVAQLNETEKANAKRITEARALANKVAKEQKELIEASQPKQSLTGEGKWDNLLPSVPLPPEAVKLVEAKQAVKQVADKTFAELQNAVVETVTIVDSTTAPHEDPGNPTNTYVANTGIQDLLTGLGELYSGLAARGENTACIVVRATQDTIQDLQSDKAIVDTIISTLKDADLVLFANKLGARQGDFIKRWRKWKNEHGVGQVSKSAQTKE